MQRSKARPLTQAEFLRLMSLMTTQRIISNGLAQLQFTDVWPSLRARAPEESVMQGLSAPKLLELRQLVRQVVLDQGRKAVVFSQWRRMLALAQWAVSDLLVERGLRAGFFSGAEGQKRRTQNIVEFHDDPDFRVLFASDAGGVGLNLQRAANCVVNLELPWNPAVLEQRIGRIYRIGQDQPIDVYNLVCEEGIESRIAGLVSSKQAFFKGLFDGDSDAIRFEQSSSFLARVESIYGPAALPDGAATAAATDGSLELEQAVASAAAAEAEADGEIDTLGDAFEPLIEAGDESQDGSAATDSGPEPEAATASTGAGTNGEGAARPDASAMPAPAEVRRLFSKLSVRRQDDGKVVIEAPAEAATALSALFEGMAALLQSVAEPADRNGSG
jgi:superfamily II DNA/RNA helicase